MSLNRSKWSALLGLGLATACGYEADFPLAAPAIRTDSALIGTWVATDSTDPADTMTVHVVAFDSLNYLISAEFASEPGKAAFYRGFVTELAGTTYLNLQLISGEERKFMFARIKRERDDWLAALLERAPERIRSPAELRAHLLSPAVQSEAFGESIRLSRRTPERGGSERVNLR